MFEFSRGNYEQKSVQILEATRGLSSTDLEGTHLIECLRSQLSAVTEEIKRLRAERDEARRMYIFCLLDAEVQLAEAEGRDFRPVTPQNFAQQMRWDCFKEGDVHVEP